MFIENYATVLANNPLFLPPDRLSISGTLSQAFRDIQATSEEAGLEYGCNLFFIGNQIVVGKVRTGAQDSVDPDTKRQSGIDSYIGDFHVHPYKQKMSAKASIGFSTGDIETYLHTHSKFRVRFHFVAGGSRLFLIAIYQWTKSQGTGPMPTTFDVQSGLDHIGANELRFNTWRTGINKRNEATRLADKIQIERDMWSKIPGYEAIFEYANDVMNRQLAAHYKYDLYEGKIGSSASHAVSLTRISG